MLVFLDLPVYGSPRFLSMITIHNFYLLYFDCQCKAAEYRWWLSLIYSKSLIVDFIFLSFQPTNEYFYFSDFRLISLWWCEQDMITWYWAHINYYSMESQVRDGIVFLVIVPVADIVGLQLWTDSFETVIVSSLTSYSFQFHLDCI